MTKFYRLTLLLIVINIFNLNAQNDTSFYKKENFFRRIGNDGKLTVQTIGYTYAQPFRWKKRDWMRFGGSIAISAAITLVDEPISDWFLRNQTSKLDGIADIGDFLGQPEHNYPFMFAVWGTGVIFNNEWLRDTGILLFASVTTSGILQTLAKDVVGRARPEAGTGAYAFKPFGGRAYHSFPSGHTMLALATAWIMAHQVKFMPLKVVFYGIPILVGLSRIYDQAHFTSDVLLGSALGIACAEAVIRLYPTFKKKLRDKQGLSFMPTGTGFSLAYRF